MYNVKSGEQYAKITITNSETVKFSDKWDVFGVKGDDITVKLNSTDSGDGVYNTDDTGGAVVIAHGRRLDTMYLTGSGDVIVWAGASAVDCPFSKSAKGGEVTLDDNVTQNSENPVKSSGIYTALSSKQNAIQYPVIPTITASMLGQIIQYVGATDANYTKGWFYEAKSDGEETPTYSWEVINFPKSGEGGDVLPSGYQKLEYVRCNGDQPGFEVTYSMPSRYEHIHEVITAATTVPTSGGSDFFGSTAYHMRGYYVVSANKPYVTYDYGSVNFMKDYNTEYDTPTILSVMPDNQNGAQGTLIIGYSTLGSRPFTGRIYSYKVYKLKGAETTISNSYYYNFVPCKRLSDDKIGFYETVNGEFYSSTTTGAEFLAPSQS